MQIGIIGAGHIGGNAARQFALAGHNVVLSYTRDPARLNALAQQIGERARPGTPAEAAACQAVMVSVPWAMIDDAIDRAGSLENRIVIDTTNQFGPGGVVTFPGGGTAAQHNAARMTGARYTKSFNTLTAGFQADAAGRQGSGRVVQWVCGDDAEAKALVMGLIDDAGYAPVDLGGLATCAVMEAPRRPGAVYGEEWRLPEALGVVEAVRDRRPIPETPRY
jgi:8-hydroxy-5-deazaflavin:NADPH oxidoreductase